MLFSTVLIAHGFRSRHEGGSMAGRQFKVVLIKPSHYDNDGYVIQWWRSGIPSNSLANVHGLLRECADAKVLGPDVEIDIEASDECNTIVDVRGRIRICGPRRRAVQPVPARARSGAPIPRRRHSGGDRRLSSERLHFDAA